ncbi:MULTISPECIES: APC family permease [Kribbella]|uniref:Amino acid/polyamine/organocation transporter (APC superfamily) n=1 Tax=Kribbella pratensis TaxID=2512112 RepID=A0ABY2FKC6_9ACTN|nr:MULTISPECIES: APC family permease [Kribbella]TDW86717.1 amino acid/polyamine/organocation transporter (APC superfamily) [Kribbella sp. VKM Ac-2566]TDW93217.1 amino acid/polyamine/organocation transporter (APC superfamily) [Kribbella pratensis]
MSDSAAVVQSGERPELKRVMGPGLLLLFVVGDILGTGVYALTGKVAGEVGGAVWLPFLCAFVVALLTATSYLELVTKYPKAGGAAVYTHKAFGIHFLTFLLTFAVMCSGLTSASSASKAFAANFFSAAHIDADRGALLMITALGFMTLIALVNLRGVGESVKANVVLTCVELSGLLIVIGIGAWALIGGDGDTSRLTDFKVPEGESPFSAVTAATALAFFAMVGFEDSVNMAEETKDPVRIFPKIMLIGLCITGVIYVLVAISAVALVSPDELNKGATPLLKVVQAGAPGFPLELFAWITMFAVANSALINMLMASRLLYGMSHEQVLPGPLGRVLRRRRTPYIAILFTTLLAFVLIGYADLAALGGTTAFLLLCVFAIVNVAVLILRRDRVEHKHFRAPTALPVLGVVLCVYLASPLSGRASADYKIAGWLMLVGVGLWIITWLLNKYVFNRHADFDPSHLDPQGPVN